MTTKEILSLIIILADICVIAKVFYERGKQKQWEKDMQLISDVLKEIEDEETQRIEEEINKLYEEYKDKIGSEIK